MDNKIVGLSESAKTRIIELQNRDNNKDKHLRITVFGGGCNGLRYEFTLDDKINPDDFKIADKQNVLLTIDDVSMGFISGSMIDFTIDLGSSYFQIVNPNAKSSCGCGDSFSV